MADHGGLEATLTRKWGPFPLWTYGLALGLLIVVVVYIRSRNKLPVPSGSDPNAEPGDPSLSGTDTGTNLNYGLPGGAIGDFLSQDPTNPAFPVGLPAQGLPGPVTNEQWARLAFDELVAKGDDPTLVENALSKYLKGEALTPAEKAIKDLAQQLFGAPPEGLLGVTIAPPPSTAPQPGAIPTGVPKPKPVAGSSSHSTRTYTVKKWPAPGSSLWSIAGIVYGDPNKWPSIYEANKSQIGGDPNKIRAGMVLTIP